MTAGVLAFLLCVLACAAPAAARTLGPNGSADGPLNRYRAPAIDRHAVSAHQVSENYSEFQVTLGFPLADAGAGRVAIHGCFKFFGEERYLSRDPGCEGGQRVESEGYLYEAQAPDTLPVYRCTRAPLRDQFASNREDCEGFGARVDLLGYAPQRQRALNRYLKILQGGGGEHWVTARRVDPGYGQEGPGITLGYVLDDPGTGRVALWSCVEAGGDHFLSGDENCPGGTRIGSEGYLHADDHGAATSGLYACETTSGEAFESIVANCEGSKLLGRLGYLIRRPVDEDLDVHAPGAEDCDDRNPAIHRDAAEIPGNAVDENCDGVVLDRDGDGSAVPLDCDDGNPGRRPGLVDPPSTPADEDCTGANSVYPLLRAIVGYTLRPRRTYAVFERLRVNDLAGGELVELRCRGRGCPRRRTVRRTAARPGSLVLTSVLRRRRLRVGAVVTIRVTRRDTIGRELRVQVRRGRSPRITRGCILPGRKAAVSCTFEG